MNTNENRTISAINPPDGFGSKDLHKRIYAFNSKRDSIDEERKKAEGKISRLQSEIRQGKGTLAKIEALRKAQGQVLLCDASEPLLVSEREDLIRAIEKEQVSHKDSITAKIEAREKVIQGQAEKAGHGDEVIEALIREDKVISELCSLNWNYSDSTTSGQIQERVDLLKKRVETALV
ncbi:hypothetical protein P0Y35_14140 [Kiritimatiellaeota bacterium B1221]|nr:hypothetical protein [Kiritimatiellaeota bacterium B1221]